MPSRVPTPGNNPSSPKSKSGKGGTAVANRKSGKAPAAPVQATVSRAPQAPSTQSNFGNYGGGGYSSPSLGGNGGGAEAMMSAALPEMTDDQYLAGDSGYQAQLAALQRAMADSDGEFTARKSRYDVDYNDSMKNLGWLDKGQGQGDWNYGDLNTAVGRANSSLENDYASRGMLQSSLYGTAKDNLMRSLNDQRTGMVSARQREFDDIGREQGAMRAENTQSRNQARVDALSRRLAGITL